MGELLENPSALQLVLVALALVCARFWWRLRSISEENAGLQREYDRAQDKSEHLQRTLDEGKEQHESALNQLQQSSKEREDGLAAEVRTLRDELDDTRSEKRQLETQQRNDQEKLTFLEEAERRLGVTFKDVASNVLQDTRESLVQTFDQKQENAKQDLQHRQNAIQEMVRPIDQSLKDLHQANVSLKASMSTHLEDLVGASRNLQEETFKLSSALRRPEVRGQWGEVQLEQCFELAGLQKDLHYKKQPAIADGQRRPDYVVNLPGERQIVVDAKTPIDAYLSALDAENDQERVTLWKRHAGNVKKSADDLSTKRYWELLEQSPDFVVMFIPSEAFYSAALQHDSGLLEYSVNKKVVIATPTNLIALLLIIHMGWQEVKLAREAEKIRRQGHELYQQAGTLVDKIIAIRRGLVSSVNAYDSAVGSLNRYFTKVETFSEPISISSDVIPELEMITMDPRMPSQKVLLAANNGQDQDDEGTTP
ncbi:MAG: DNA recombination protein RmuC [Anaerolineaceae bacterium]|nr:DNA recombination protein RmuC [Anaerolineaceae bacterium]